MHHHLSSMRKTRIRCAAPDLEESLDAYYSLIVTQSPPTSRSAQFLAPNTIQPVCSDSVAIAALLNSCDQKTGRTAHEDSLLLKFLVSLF